MDTESMTQRDRDFLEAVYRARQVARINGFEPKYLQWHLACGQAIGSPIEPQPEVSTANPLPPKESPSKPFDGNETIYADSLNETISDEHVPQVGCSKRSHTEQEIIDVLTDADHALKATQISRLAGKGELTEYFRKKIYALVRKKELIVLDDNRYWLASRERPSDIP